jgi:hypothetical protein
MVLQQYRAIASYTKQDRKELSFQEGDIFEVVEKNDNGTSPLTPPHTPTPIHAIFSCKPHAPGWWFVSNDADTQGWVPATFLEPLECAYPPPPAARLRP